MTKETTKWVATIKEHYDLTPEGEVLLAEAAALRDRISQAEAAITEHGLMMPVRGGGAPRINPAAKVAQDARSLLLRYMLALGLEST